ncbi:MAG TPA: GNAT family protein [Streptosporangiaceae bacterium]
MISDLWERLEGRLVVLEPLSFEHEEGLFEAASDGELFTWLPDNPGASPESMRRWLTTAVEAARREQEVPFAILSTSTGKPVGSTRFQEIRLEHLRAEIGWTWLARQVWGSGANVEAKLMLLTHVFEIVGCRRVEFKADARNARSCGALEALGARFEGIFRKHMVLHNGGARDSAYYSVIDDEWPQVKALLTQRLERHLRRQSPAAGA